MLMGFGDQDLLCLLHLVACVNEDSINVPSDAFSLAKLNVLTRVWVSARL